MTARRAIWQNLPSLHPPASPLGFLGGLFPTPLYHLHPCRRAFAGMTTGLELVCYHSDSPFAIPGKFLTLAPPSFRRRPESSGLFHTFPHSGNDNHGATNRTRPPIKPAIPSLPGLPSWIPRRPVPDLPAAGRRGSTTYIPVGVDSGFRRNDEGARTDLSPS